MKFGKVELASRLHRVAIRLLRRLRVEDRTVGIGSAQLSALSVLVYAGPQTLGGLANAEQLRLPTISRLVRQMEADGLVRRRRDTADARVQWVETSPAGRRILERARRKRLTALERLLSPLSKQERDALEIAVALLERRLS